MARGEVAVSVQKLRALQSDPRTMSTCYTLQTKESPMTLCPIALAVGCKRCSVFAICPVKGVIGDYRKQDETPAERQTRDENE